MKHALLVLTLLFSIQSKAIGPCDNLASLKSLWETKYSTIVQASALDFDKSQLLAQAICFLDNARIPNLDFFSYLKKFISSGISIVWSGSGDDGSGMARTNYHEHSIALLPNYFNSDPYFNYRRASVLIHETRHLEIRKRIDNHENATNLINAHVPCTRGMNANKGFRDACDPIFSNSLPDASAYSYEVIFFRMLYDYSPYNLNRKELAEWIVFFLKNSFNSVSPALYNQYTSGFEKYLNQVDLAYNPRTY